MNPSRDFSSNIPLLALVGANTVPLWGVLFAGWDAFLLVLLYWAENVIVGFYNILRIATAKTEHIAEQLGKLFMIPFFVVHYGGFTAVHGLFVLFLFQKGEGARAFPAAREWPCFFAFVQLLINVIKEAFAVAPESFRVAFSGLMVSHGVSFVYNYLLKGEYANATGKDLMARPYGRIVVMHIAVLAGAFLTMAVGSPVAILTVLVVLKTFVDVQLHLREHKKMKAKRA